MLDSLPIDPFLPSLRECVAKHPITLLEAPPGTGKTTRAAPALLDLPLVQGKRIYLLQPRRLAAKSVAERIASEQNSRIGNRIGYQVRFDSRISSQTQLIVATEGILLRRLQEDASLSDTSIVVLDEFHERSLDSDLLLGMLRRVQQAIRDDLRLVIMSATLESSAIQTQLGGAPVIRVQSQNYPVKVFYQPPKAAQRPVEQMVEVLQEVVPKHDGDVLAFLPGAGEIRRCCDRLAGSSLARDCDIRPLHGSMQLEEQSRAIETGSRRKIVLSTNIAETSLTIEGVRVVVDSGLARVMRYSPDVGLDRLSMEPISQSSAIQRTGRAGRVAPGVCYRLWSEASDRSRPAFLEPEIRRTDIVSCILQLVAWGEGESDDFPWLEVPRPDTKAKAMELLAMLGAVSNHKITPIGKAMAALPTHPRLARMVIAGYQTGCLSRVCLLAAMLSERDPFDRSDSSDRPSSYQQRSIHTQSARRWDSDCVERVAAIESFLDGRFVSSPFGQLHRSSVHTIAQSANQLRDQCIDALEQIGVQRGRDAAGSTTLLMQSLVAGFPDRLAKRRAAGKTTGLMVGGKGVALSPQSGVTEAELFLCVDVEASAGDATVRQASRVDFDWLSGETLHQRDDLYFHAGQKQVVARRQILWHDLVLKETPASIQDDEACGKVLFQAALRNWEQAFPVGDEQIEGLVARVRCLQEWVPTLELPTLDLAFLQEVAAELCRSRRSLAELRSAPWVDWIRTRFTNEQWIAIEKEAPPKIMVPSGSWIKIRYEHGKPPTMAVKIQEIFSWRKTPTVAMGRVPILLELLSPNMRPQQITNDLVSFWENGYPIVKKELKRRYPKHSWPDDPLTATPGRR